MKLLSEGLDLVLQILLYVLCLTQLTLQLTLVKGKTPVTSHHLHKGTTDLLVLEKPCLYLTLLPSLL